jgi:hypothetical protein
MMAGGCGAFSGMRIYKRNQSTWREPASVPIVHHKSLMTWRGIEPGPRSGNPATNRQKYGMVRFGIYSNHSDLKDYTQGQLYFYHSFLSRL